MATDPQVSVREMTQSKTPHIPTTQVQVNNVSYLDDVGDTEGVQGTGQEPNSTSIATVGESSQKMESLAKRRSKTLKTPVHRRVGLGIECTTPGSLYDGEGFLKNSPEL
jgi:hypothetical protein